MISTFYLLAIRMDMNTVIPKIDFGEKHVQTIKDLVALVLIPTEIGDTIGVVKVLPEILVTKLTMGPRPFLNRRQTLSRTLSWLAKELLG